MPASSCGVLHASPLVEVLLVDGQLYPFRAQQVGEPERERCGHARTRDPDRLDRPDGDLDPCLVVGHPAREQLVAAELLERMQLEDRPSAARRAISIEPMTMCFVPSCSR